MSARAGVIVTGTEVLTGRVRDANGPWLADQLLELGIELAHVGIVGDRVEDMEAQLRFMDAQDMDLIVTTGGLGPTADDKTVEVVAQHTGRPLEMDERLFDRIAEILKPMMERWPHLSPEAVLESERKQALVPRGAYVIDPAGTAPGFVVPPREGSAGATIVVMPGPPRELAELWPEAVESDEFQAATRGRSRYAPTS